VRSRKSSPTLNRWLQDGQRISNNESSGTWEDMLWVELLI
jgi:hypothetical protein